VSRARDLPPTKADAETVRAFARLTARLSYPPTLRELAEELALGQHVNTIAERTERCLRKGLLERFGDRYTARALRLTEKGARLAGPVGNALCDRDVGQLKGLAPGQMLWVTEGGVRRYAWPR
jgi:hypothetical protein